MKVQKEKASNRITTFEVHAERLIKISKEKPLLPEKFIPWNDEPDEKTKFMPSHMISLEGHPSFELLTNKQQVELGKLEMGQVMYSYAWSETLACYFFNRHLLKLNPDTVEYRFLIRELIEEFRHQEMFGMAIRKLGVKPIEPRRGHKLLANFMTRFCPPSIVFMSIMSIELMADIYAKHIRKDPQVYSVLRKVSELHHIEEGRHIFYTKLWLKKFTDKAGFIKSSIYSIVVMLSILFLKSLYIQEEFFNKIGVKHPKKMYKDARRNYNKKFAKFALDESLEFVKSIGGVNWFTKPLWKLFLKAEL